MTRIGSAQQSVLLRQIANNRTQMDDLHRQISSGKVADTYGGLGSERGMAVSLRAEKSDIEGFQNTITLVQTRLQVMDVAVGQLRKTASDMSSQMIISGYEPTDTGQTLAQIQAGARLADAVDTLNTDVGGRSLFAGANIDELPVVTPKEMLDGAGDKAGFRQIMDERRQADVGSDGMGRLSLAASGATEVVLLEDVSGSPFGFKLDGLRTDLTGVTTTGPIGDPSGITVDFSLPLPEDSEQLFISFDLPDGTTTELELTAISDGDIGVGEFLIGADAAATAVNFQAALGSLLEREAETSLSAASMQAAANDFFTSGTDEVQRVDGPPFDTATGLRDGTSDDTVEWYIGDRSDTPARETALARIDDNRLVAYGARADEEAFSTMIKQFAILASATFDPAGDNDQARYTAMGDRVRDTLSNSDESKTIDRVIGELAIAQSALGEASDRHTSADNMVTTFLSEIETADINEAAVNLLSLQTQLQASYQVTSMLSNLSLVNFL
ncbi:MAG: flagellar biosynthesis protein FlgL [bacterium]|nr:flagellar biosynthesis protein FlgL [bacterium]